MVIICLLYLVLGLSAQNPFEIPNSKEPETITAKVNETFLIELPGVTTKGRDWILETELKKDESIVQKLGSSFMYNNSEFEDKGEEPAGGIPGEYKILFSAEKTGTIDLKFVYTESKIVNGEEEDIVRTFHVIVE
ncbi:MAG: hypothetical protein EZS28_018566 [Streblomastix strix]|uniref:Proteinase inhibitor I42 chagasin domain-containing protein n=1 Tax=Streblomastix strix TaxID=222440 RepID=A0A5J4VUQ9_9EUKA|nr:MAG: hypothetical protein EZS28_018566 [Streblomastix strix]